MLGLGLRPAEMDVVQCFYIGKILPILHHVHGDRRGSTIFYIISWTWCKHVDGRDVVGRNGTVMMDVV